jgi:hypothetical protein
MYLKDSVDHKDLQSRMDTLMRRGLIWNLLKLL